MSTSLEEVVFNRLNVALHACSDFDLRYSSTVSNRRQGTRHGKLSRNGAESCDATGEANCVENRGGLEALGRRISSVLHSCDREAVSKMRHLPVPYQKRMTDSECCIDRHRVD